MERRTMLHRRRRRRRGKRATNDSNPSSPGRSSASTSTTTTMSRHSKFYVPFLIAGMIFTVRPSPNPGPRCPSPFTGLLQLALVQVSGPPVRRGLRHEPPRVLRAASLADPPDVWHVFLVYLPTLSPLTDHVPQQPARCYASITSSLCTVLG